MKCLEMTTLDVKICCKNTNNSHRLYMLYSILPVSITKNFENFDMHHFANTGFLLLIDIYRKRITMTNGNGWYSMADTTLFNLFIYRLWHYVLYPAKMGVDHRYGQVVLW